jgi:hypothetical protein
VFDFFNESVTEWQYPWKLNVGDIVDCMAFVSPNCLILVVVPENGTLAIRVAVMEGVAVAAWILWVIGLDDFPSNDAVVNAIFHVLNDRVTHRQGMV